jgi:hypothetical protein
MRIDGGRGAAALAVAAVLWGCAATGDGKGAAGDGAAGKGAASGAISAAGEPFYAEEWKDGRFTVFGSEKVHAAWRKGVHLTTAKTYIGAGPDGVTVVLEEDAKDPALRARIQTRFEQRYGVDLSR